MRLLKVSLPFSDAPSGCEFIYGAVVAEHSAPPREGFESVIQYPRTLIRFAYDYKNMRCESKDLSIPQLDPPLSLTFQFIDTHLSSTTIDERPRDPGVKLILRGSEMRSVEAVRVPQTDPFRSTVSSPRISRMSTTIQNQEVSLLFGPAQSFNSAVEGALQSAIKRCREEKICVPVKMAVSVIKQINTLRLIDEASEAGLPIELITNSGERTYYPGSYKPYLVKTAPWNWTRGNRHLGQFRGILQMHTKFVIVGDDLVISSNVNLVNDSKRSSRGLTVVYRNREVGRMFAALFTTLRSGITYPLTVDRKDNFILLVNAERPRRYVASAQRPFTIMRTEDGTVSNAYGILLEEIAQHPGHLSLYMSPITDSCFSFQTRRCFREELSRRAAQKKLSLGLSGTFYLAPKSAEKGRPMWKSLDLNEDSTWHPRAKSWLPFFRTFRDAVDVFTDRWGAYTVHHERFAVLGDDTILSGSANFVFPFSVNTVEILKSKDLATEAKKELSTYDESLFVAQGAPGLGQFGSIDKNCFFYFERAVRHSTGESPKAFSGDEVLEKIKERGFAERLDQIRLVVPTLSTLQSLSSQNSFEYREVTSSFDSPSSYVCLWRPDTDTSIVVRLTPIQLGSFPK